MDEKKVDELRASSPRSDPEALSPHTTIEDGETKKLTWKERVLKPGSVWQIIIAAVLAIAIGLAVSTTVDEVPEAAIELIAIPGTMWLRALRAVVLPMIVTAMILAIQRLREMSKDGKRLAQWTVGYYVITTLIAVMHSCILVGLVWSKLMVVVGEDALKVKDDDQETIDERKDVAIHDVVVDMFHSFVPQNIVNALATDALLAVLMTSIVIGYCIRDANSALLKAVIEIEQIIMRVITQLIYWAPVGVFHLILPNLFRLDIAEIGRNLGILIGGTLVGMVLHLFIIIPLIFFVIVRQNPYTFWLKNSPAWITAWGTASSAATLPVTMRCVLERGVPVTIAKFCVPLGCLINMDGTAIYFPIVVVFLAATQGITLNAANYIVVCLLSTLASIGTTPIPSSSLVLTVMIATSVNVPITGMYAVVVAIDWFLDRFRTAVNVSADTFAAVIMQKITKITDDEDQDGTVHYTESRTASHSAQGNVADGRFSTTERRQSHEEIRRI
ncbi:excitatory amino acid transporter 1 [Aaosphaeria arxii CBS 175.79]|uniref:Amino acid transporter n=1 Tax=Aaosphaeria arxii CBS 175.79 TaxID=1450172 RepID=A0A6A5Y3K7_9PLEO|nr:excitatory amino acid transporter 1 [Aaosphaeria arxii CBS 175.79]KAF2019803.1 excitatory amino acid transporter 1 [Aaosphaeria arxii CBS 175.79]